jgi:hypothetical protein
VANEINPFIEECAEVGIVSIMLALGFDENPDKSVVLNEAGDGFYGRGQSVSVAYGVELEWNLLERDSELKTLSPCARSARKDKLEKF